MLSKNELRYLLALQRVPKLGDVSAKKLLQCVGSAEGIFKEKKQHLLKISGIGEFKLKNLNDLQLLEQADEELQFMEANDIAWSYFKDEEYPHRLRHCPDGPILFFRKGNISLENNRVISVVGTRKATTYGRDFCEKIIAELAPLNPVIVSGFAFGIDIIAHRAALDHGLQTIACMAHGLNQVYPKVHERFVKKVEEHGGFITEFWSCDTFDRNNFLQRNRIIAGLSEATIVIESAEKGGSLVTADIANSYNREVFAVPGKTTDLQSRGCNDLIKSQQAHLLSEAADIVYLLGWDIHEKLPELRQIQLFPELSAEEQAIFNYLQNTEKELLDTIALDCKMPAFKTASLLLNMELKGVIRPLPGKFFQLI